MIARKKLPESYLAWNRRHHAPWGRARGFWRRWGHHFPSGIRDYLSGPFSIQPNSSTRTFEYPWAFYATSLQPGLKVLEIGGGLSGFQFVLNRAGCSVTNLDPGQKARGMGWPCDIDSMTRLNSLWGTSVELRNTTMAETHFDEESFDRVFSISVLEHLPEDEITDLLPRVFRCLKPGGYFVLTVDLFLNITPFTQEPRNEWGTNINIRQMLELAPFKLIEGTTVELNGFPGFDPKEIQDHLGEFYQGNYPVLSQCLILQK